MLSPSCLGPFDIADDEPFIFPSPKLRLNSYLVPHVADVEWRAHVQGTCVHVTRREVNPLPVDPPSRGVVTSFSSQSRMRLYRLLNKIDWNKIKDQLFITLTYPDEVPFDKFKTRNKHRSRFLRDLERYVGYRVPAVWRCEWKKRQTGWLSGQYAPHTHYILFGVKPMTRAELRGLWKPAIKWDKFVSVDVQKIVGYQGALKYLAKYVSKEEPLDISTYLNNSIQTGRHWGSPRKALLPMAEVVVDTILTEEQVGMMQVLEMEANERYDPGIDGGFTLLGGNHAVNALQQLGKTC